MAPGAVLLYCLALCSTLATCAAADSQWQQRLSLFLQRDIGAQWQAAYQRRDDRQTYRTETGQQSAELSLNGEVLWFYQDYREKAPTSTARELIPKSQAVRIAQGYVERAGLPFDASRLVVGSYTFREKEHEYSIVLTAYHDQVELPVRVHLDFDASDGALRRYTSTVHMPVTVSLEPAITRQRAISIARAHCQLADAELDNAHLMVWTVPTPPPAPGETRRVQVDEQALMWQVTMKGRALHEEYSPARGIVTSQRAVIEEFRVDAHTGQLHFVARMHLEQEDNEGTQGRPEPSRYLVYDQCPVWLGPDELLFATTRTTQTTEPEYERPERCQSLCRLSVLNGHIESIVADGFTFAPIHPAISPDGSMVAFQNGWALGILDLQTGNVGQLLSRRSNAHSAAWHPGGEWLAVSVVREGRRAIHRVNVDRQRLRARGSTALVRSITPPFRPVFDPMGKWFVFTTRERTDGLRQLHSVQVVYLDGSGAPIDGPKRVADHIVAPLSVSAFPAGGRVLVCHEDGLEQLSVTTGVRSALPWKNAPSLVAPAEEPLLRVRDACLSPQGDQVAFSGLRWSQEPEDPAGWYIYVCNLDGSQLRRVTPLEDTPVEPYVFPESGKTAFDVAKEIAGQRMFGRE